MTYRALISNAGKDEDGVQRYGVRLEKWVPSKVVGNQIIRDSWEFDGWVALPHDALVAITSAVNATEFTAEP